MAVSSIAAVHAFPSFDDAFPVDSMVTIDMADSMQSSPATNPMSDGMQPGCHQASAEASNADANNACEIFCAAMSIALSNEPRLDFDSPKLARDVVTLSGGFSTRQPDVEPQPPK